MQSSEVPSEQPERPILCSHSGSMLHECFFRTFTIFGSLPFQSPVLPMQDLKAVVKKLLLAFVEVMRDLFPTAACAGTEQSSYSTALQDCAHVLM